MLVILILVGLSSAILVNYLADVLPFRRRLAAPFCLDCGQNYVGKNFYGLGVYLLLLNCPSCGSRRKIRSWAVLFALIFLSILLWHYPHEKLGYMPSYSVVVYFSLVVVIDLEHRLIMNPVSLAGSILGLILGFVLHGWQSTLIGGAAGYVFMLAFYLLGFGFVRIVNKLRKNELGEEALGYGDVNLSGVMGLFLGWPGVLVGLLIAILLAGIISLFYFIFAVLTRQYQPTLSLPYGPFLVASILLLIFFQNTILNTIY